MSLTSARAWRARHRALELCVHCTAPAAINWDGRVLHACERHLKRDQKRKHKPARRAKRTSNPANK